MHGFVPSSSTASRIGQEVAFNGKPDAASRPAPRACCRFSPFIGKPGGAAACRSVNTSAIFVAAAASSDRWPTGPRSTFMTSWLASPGIPGPPLIVKPRAVAVRTIPSPGPNENAAFCNSCRSPVTPSPRALIVRVQLPLVAVKSVAADPLGQRVGAQGSESRILTVRRNAPGASRIRLPVRERRV